MKYFDETESRKKERKNPVTKEENTVYKVFNTTFGVSLSLAYTDLATGSNNR